MVTPNTQFGMYYYASCTRFQQLESRSSSATSSGRIGCSVALRIGVSSSKQRRPYGLNNNNKRGSVCGLDTSRVTLMLGVQPEKINQVHQP